MRIFARLSESLSASSRGGHVRGQALYSARGCLGLRPRTEWIPPAATLKGIPGRRGGRRRRGTRVLAGRHSW